MSVYKYTFFLAKLKEGEDIPFLERAGGGGGGTAWDFLQKQCVVGKVFFLESAEEMQHEITPKSTVAIRDSESIFFREIRK